MTMGRDHTLIFGVLFILMVTFVTKIVTTHDHDHDRENEGEGPIVEIDEGKLRGINLVSRNGRPYYAFRQVPFAKAGRFENPKPADAWNGIYNASGKGVECIQIMWVSYVISGVEDCLKLNIYTPNVNGNYPVMVYFHGGGFTVGNGNYYGGDYFMDEDVVIVYVNYRLGPFGFLSTGDDVISGNFGLKDQTAALRFVSKNIAQFGGNPQSVTVFGSSAGGASAHYHMLSPQSSGLITAVISESGSALNPWAFSRKPRFMAEKFARALNCPLDSQKFLSCLKAMSPQEILEGTKPLVEWGYDPFTPFGPVIESKNSVDPFLTQSPTHLMETGNFNRVPWLTGLAEDEGILMHSAFIMNNPELVSDLEKNWKKIFPITLEFNEVYTNASETEQIYAAQEIYDYYFQKNPTTIATEDTRQALTDMFSDRFFNHGVIKGAILASKFVPVFPFIFAHNRKDFCILEFLNIEGNYGVSHADEVSFLHSQAFDLAPPFEKDSRAEGVSKNLVKLWVSFARDGKPTHLWPKNESWEPMSSDCKLSGGGDGKPAKFCWIDDIIVFKTVEFWERMEFWENLEKKLLQKDDHPSSSSLPSKEREEL